MKEKLNTPIRKEAYFGGTETSVNNADKEVLEINDYFANRDFSALKIWDGEIEDNEDSSEVVCMADADHENEDRFIFFIHKKDCLQIANFLLGIHTRYAERQNELEFDRFRKQTDERARAWAEQHPEEYAEMLADIEATDKALLALKMKEEKEAGHE